jgi:hypothetical protein
VKYFLMLDGDSIYLPLSKYYTTPGTKQTIVMPFTDFTPLASGNGTFDFKHLKDWTFVDPKPLGGSFVFSNMKLIGGGSECHQKPKPTVTTEPLNSSSLALQAYTMILGVIGFIYLVFAV